MTTICLALGGALPPIVRAMSEDPAPAVLCSYVFYRVFKPLLTGEVGKIREWYLDSGAFSAMQANTTISVEQYIEFCLSLRESKLPPSAIFALDVIGDWRASMRNTEIMWKAGVEAIPCYHAGEPSRVLEEMVANYPRIALGGAAGVLYGEARYRYLAAAFAKAWPKRIHGFGINDPKLLSQFPFDSGDATSWELGVLRFGIWKSSKLKTPWLRRGHNLRPEVDYYLDLERQLEAKWSGVLKEVRDGKRRR